jgi:hypothetical protein
MHLCFNWIRERDNGRCLIVYHSRCSPDLVRPNSNSKADRERRGIPVNHNQAPPWERQAVFPLEQQRGWFQRPHCRTCGLQFWKPAIQNSHVSSKVLGDKFGLVPFANSLWAADKLIEWYEEWTHSFDATKLMPKLASRFSHCPWGALGLEHHVMQELHGLVELFL